MLRVYSAINIKQQHKDLLLPELEALPQQIRQLIHQFDQYFCVGHHKNRPENT